MAELGDSGKGGGYGCSYAWTSGPEIFERQVPLCRPPYTLACQEERAGLNDLGLQRRKPGSSKKNMSGECVVATAQELPFLSGVP